MVAKRNATILEEMGSQNLISFFDTKTISVDSEKLELSKELQHHVVKNVINHKKFSEISDQNEFKKFILEMNNVIKECKKFNDIAPYIHQGIIQKKALTFPSDVVKLLYLACDTWQVGVDLVVDSILEKQNNN
jgi:hypothetical protein